MRTSKRRPAPLVYCLSIAIPMSVLAVGGAAHAQAEPLPPLPPAPSASPEQERPATPPATPVSHEGDTVPWRRRYDDARERLLAGDFEDAARRFDSLARSAEDPGDRALAESMRDLAQVWADRGAALTTRQEAPPASATIRGQRSVDELAQLYAASIVYGIGTGLWVDSHTQPNTAGGVVLPMVLFSGIAAGTVAVLDAGHPGHPLRYGVPQSIVSGMNIGFESGLVLALWNQSLSDPSARWPGTTAADVTWAFSTVGAIGGGALGAALGTTPGRASFTGSAALWTGVVAGFAAAAASGDADRGSNALLAAEVGLGAGTLAGLVAAGSVSPSIARVRFLDIGAICGGLLFGGLYLGMAGKEPDAQVGSFFTAAGVAGGLAISWAATSSMPADRPEAAHEPVVAFEPALSPVPGGATLGVRGTLDRVF